MKIRTFLSTRTASYTAAHYTGNLSLELSENREALAVIETTQTKAELTVGGGRKGKGGRKGGKEEERALAHMRVRAGKYEM